MIVRQGTRGEPQSAVTCRRRRRGSKEENAVRAERTEPGCGRDSTRERLQIPGEKNLFLYKRSFRRLHHRNQCGVDCYLISRIENMLWRWYYMN